MFENLLSSINFVSACFALLFVLIVVLFLNWHFLKKIKKLEIAKDNLRYALEDAIRRCYRAEKEKNNALSLLKNFNDGLIIINKKNEISFINDSAEKLLDIEKEIILNKPLSKLKHIQNINPMIDLMQSALKGIYKKETEAKKGPILEMSVSPIKHSGNIDGNLITLRDITKEKISQKRKSELISLLAHQLRIPTSTVKWSLSMMSAGDFGKISKEQKGIIKKIMQRNEEMVSLIDGLLEISRNSDGEYLFNPVPTDIASVVQSLINFYQEEIKNKKIRLEFQKPTIKLPEIVLDKEKIKLAIQNVIDNAIKYTPEGGEIKILLFLRDGKMQLEVKDSGIGIPEDQKEKIFTKFFRADNARLKEKNGSGLGLFFVKNIIEQNHGKIWFSSPAGSALGGESVQNKGSAFYITLPLE